MNVGRAAGVIMKDKCLLKYESLPVYFDRTFASADTPVIKNFCKSKENTA